MSQALGPGGPDLPPEFVELIRSLFGPNADEAIEAIKEAGIDLGPLMESVGLGADSGASALLSQQFQRIFQGGDPGQAVDWLLAHDAARRASLGKGPDPSVSRVGRAEVAEAFKVADIWLNQATELAALDTNPQALSAADWIELTMDSWKTLTAPVAESVTKALAKLFEDHPGVFAEGEVGALGPEALLGRMASTLFGLQLGTAIGMLSREVFGLTDTGLPLGRRGAVALLPSAVDGFAAEISLPADEVRLFLAARESAHSRLFGHVPWLGDRLVGAVESYAGAIKIDLAKLEESIRDLGPPTRENLEQAMRSGVFSLESSESQKAALERLETALALVEGWVSVVTGHALERNLPDVASLSEMMRRRRAAGGPAEHAMAALVGLELRPRRARQAGVLWETVTEAIGPLERDRLWSHPDLLPTPEDLDQPESFLDRQAERAQADQAIDAEIAAFFDQES
jgi:putative hydrolase